MRILPTTTPARIAVLIDAVAIAVYVAVLLSVDRLGAARVLGLGPPLLAMAAGSILAVVAIARRDERSLLAWVALVPGVLVVLALLAEITGLIE